MAAPHFPDPQLLDLLAAKHAARERALAVRGGRDPGAGSVLAGHVLEHAPPPPDAVVAGFWPIRGEIDVRPLLLALAGRGHRIALPVTPPRGHPLVFRAWHFGEALHPGRFGTSHPAGPVLVPDVILVPLLAFDRTGHRLGYGAGYYDRTLGALPGACTIGCAFAAQELDEVPAGPYDARLQAVATERGLIRIGPS